MTHESTAVGLASAYSNATTASGDWWRDAVIYQVYVRSFADSDGDGIGDLRGVRSRLPHLARLGVDAVWLTPFYVSPQADGGYDVADYRAVDPLFGDLADADELVRAAHELGLRVIVDVVPNHTSEQHPWFRAALAGEPGARERYLFRRGRGADGSLPPNDWESIFGGPAWTRVADGEWYLHLFAPEQPDLDWTHPEVTAEFDSVLRFWLDLGVDGFRIDVAHGMVKADGLPDIGRGAQATLIGAEPLPFFDQDGVHEIHRSWRRLLDSYEGARIGVAEAWAPSSERLALYVRPDELHQAFNFRFLNCPWDPAAMRTVIDESLSATTAVGAPTTWVLSNHDVVRHVTRYGGGPRGLARARAAAMLMLSLPGSAYLYQGEELGLPEVSDLPPASRQDPAFRRGRRQQIPVPAGAPAPGPATPGIIAPRPGEPPTRPGAGIGNGPEADAGPAPEQPLAPQAHAPTQPQAGASTGPAPETQGQTGAGPAPEPQLPPQANDPTRPETGSGTGSQAGGAGAGTRPQAATDCGPAPEAQGQTGPEAEAGIGPQAQACCRPQAETGAGAGPDLLTAPEAEGQDGLRDGCRVPIPWAGAEPPYGFGPAGSWLPQPPEWAGLSVAAQTGDPHSTLELYRAALELRRAMPGLGAPGAGPSPDPSGMRWLPSPDGVLLFTRPGFACTLNTRPEPVELPAPGRPVLSSAPVETDGRTVRLPPDSCTWWAF
ncbi:MULTISPECIES: glycoside hydrolase family 13 protein [Streptomyces]|uniref:glycoside hydrolase family 13 protein n=1 Tax=Streptomyces TaxID=1883 RepID=UPI00068CD9D5|nr:MULTISPECIES: glycoside hydrolase family 13 protein [Streptomyces]KOU16371.1 alpha-glucosidase [Streptomyces sp. WM6349]KOV42646.1 alpha-glucosidase [Streptomyces sp. H036]